MTGTAGSRSYGCHVIVLTGGPVEGNKRREGLGPQPGLLHSVCPENGKEDELKGRPY